MKRLSAVLLAVSALSVLPAATLMAQAPAGTEQDRRGQAASGSGNPAPQQELKTHESGGKVRIEDGREVKTEAGNVNNDSGRDDSAEHSGKGGPTDPSTSPGSVE